MAATIVVWDKILSLNLNIILEIKISGINLNFAVGIPEIIFQVCVCFASLFQIVWIILQFGNRFNKRHFLITTIIIELEILSTDGFDDWISHPKQLHNTIAQATNAFSKLLLFRCFKQLILLVLIKGKLGILTITLATLQFQVAMRFDGQRTLYRTHHNLYDWPDDRQIE